METPILAPLQTKKIHKLECVHCKEIVERMIPVKKPCCFSCKSERHKKYSKEHQKKNS